MKKTSLSATLLIGALILVGAGCNFKTVADDSNNQPTNSTPKTTENATEIKSGELTLTAELVAGKTVKLAWVKSADMATGSVMRLMHSSVDNPTFPVPEKGVAPYWYQPGPTRTEYSWKNIPAGTRYFRVCEFKNNACVRLSQSIKVEVK